MLLSLDMKGIAASSGSACTSKSLKASHVHLAMGLDHATAQGSIVFSLLEETTAADIDFLLDVFPPIIDRLRKMSPLYTDFLKENKR
jgi:cysteine desulfurase